MFLGGEKKKKKFKPFTIDLNEMIIDLIIYLFIFCTTLAEINTIP